MNKISRSFGKKYKWPLMIYVRAGETEEQAKRRVFHDYGFIEDLPVFFVTGKTKRGIDFE